jgi:hypothetical protein
VAGNGFDELAPIRLPDEAELTALASAAPLMTDLRDLAREVRETAVRTHDVDPLLFRLAVETELVERDGDTLVPGDDVEWLDEPADLEAWDYTFAQVLDTTLAAVDDETDPLAGEDLDLTGQGIAMVTELFLRGLVGVPIAELSASLKSAAVAELSPRAAERQWEECARAYAARELLAFAAGEGAAVRTVAMPIVSQLGAAAEPAWREALDRSELRCYAKPALLAQLADRDPGSAVPAELKPAIEDLAWLVADTFGPLTRLDHGNTTFPFDMAKLSDAGWAVSHETIFETMARLEHPDAEAVLTMLGKHADNKKTAKASPPSGLQGGVPALEALSETTPRRRR